MADDYDRYAIIGPKGPSGTTSVFIAILKKHRVKPAKACRFLTPRKRPANCSTSQGGLDIDQDPCAIGAQAGVLPNLFASVGLVRGMSGKGADGYLAGISLLSAAGPSKAAGRAATQNLRG